jgi:PAS domain S-box-containing protein
MEELRSYQKPFDEMVNTQKDDLKRTNEEHQRSGKHYPKLVDHSQLAAAICIEENIVTVNSAYTELVNASNLNELIGKSFLDLIHPDYWESEAERMLKIESNDIVSEPSQIKIVTLDSKVIDVEICYIPTVFYGKPAIQVLIFDNTKHIQLEEQLRQAQKLESVGLLSSGIAHDFSNILTGIIGYADLALDGVAIDSSSRAFIDAIIKKSDEAATLIRQIMVFSRKRILDIKVVDLNDILRQITEFLNKLLLDNIKISTEIAPDLSLIMADTLAIQQILTNLCINSQAAMPEGGQIFISLKNIDLDYQFCRVRNEVKPGEYTKITVRDTGIGMQKEVLDHIFDPFFTTKDDGEGTGLGLSMVHGLVKLLKGYIECHSEPGHGTSFEIYFPASKVGVKEDVLPEICAVETGSESVLIVEDDLDVLILLQSILQHLGYKVFTATNGKEAYNFLQQNDKEKNINLIISDLSMPEMDGIKLREKMPGMKFLLISGHFHVGQRKFNFDADTDFLQKPFTSRQLNMKIRKLLDGF